LEAAVELLLISDSKLKVMLTPEDMSRFELTCESIDYDNVETRHAFWSILNEAKQQIGFDAAADRVFVQVYPSKSGGCEMFVTKIDISNVSKSSVKSTTVPPRSRKLAQSIFAFDDMEAMLSACYHINGSDNYVTSDAYCDERRRYYLAIHSEIDRSSHAYERGRGVDLKFPAAIEYGYALDDSSALSYIHEHCHCICVGNAIDQLARLSGECCAR